MLMIFSFGFTIFIYSKAPKKCRELEEVVSELRRASLHLTFLTQVELGLYVPVAHVLLHIRYVLWSGYWTDLGLT